jgi:hypothetical protein
MQRVICFVFIFLVLSIIHLGSCSTSTPINSIVGEDDSSERDDISLPPSASSTIAVEPIDEDIVDTVIKPIVEDIVDNVTEPTTTITTTTIRYEEPVKQFLTKVNNYIRF